MKVTILDTQTGKTVENRDYEIFFWVDGNGSCDCNRAILALGSNEADKLGEDGICLGCKRFIITECSEPWNVDSLNDGYPPELLEKHGLKPQTK